MTGLILAGGQGTRLRHLWHGPKCMAPVHGQPFINYQLNWLRFWGINSLVVCAGYRFDQIKVTADIEISVEDEPLGTAGAVKHAMSRYCHMSDPIVVLNGDTLCDLDLWHMIGQHIALESTMTVAINQVPSGVYVISACAARQLPDKGMLEDSYGSLYEHTGQFLDIGTPEGYEQADKFVSTLPSSFTNQFCGRRN